MKWNSLLVLLILAQSVGCGKRELDDSAYVLIRYSSLENSKPALRAYFIDGDATLNGIDCRELLKLSNEAILARKSSGESNLMKYECISLRDARERGFK